MPYSFLASAFSSTYFRQYVSLNTLTARPECSLIFKRFRLFWILSVISMIIFYWFSLTLLTMKNSSVIYGVMFLNADSLSRSITLPRYTLNPAKNQNCNICVCQQYSRHSKNKKDYPYLLRAEVGNLLCDCKCTTMKSYTM